MEDLPGKQFDYLLVIKRGQSVKRNDGRYDSTFICRCKCGNIVSVKGISLKRGNTTSCGCKRLESVGSINRKHSQSKTRLHGIWERMKQRCYSQNTNCYSYYGARGMAVCEEWINDYNSFQKWAYENSYNENLTLDRIDVNGNYCPENCKWSTRKEQANNTTATRYLTYKGITKPLSYWSDEVGIKGKTILKRIDILGWTVEEALTTPVKNNRRNTNV